MNPFSSFVFFALVTWYAVWTIQWRCRPGTFWTDYDGMDWTRRALVLVSLAIVLVALAAINWVLTCQH
jgi:hypothetical protein